MCNCAKKAIDACDQFNVHRPNESQARDRCTNMHVFLTEILQGKIDPDCILRCEEAYKRVIDVFTQALQNGANMHMKNIDDDSAFDVLRYKTDEFCDTDVWYSDYTGDDAWHDQYPYDYDESRQQNCAPSIYSTGVLANRLLSLMM